MKKIRVLFISNIEVPYRTRFFNLLGKECDLTVLYEQKKSRNRNEEWAKSEVGTYKKIYLHGIEVGHERSFSFSILKYVFSDYDKIIIGCFNNPVQMFAIVLMKLFHREYYINVDGKTFDTGCFLKRVLRRFFLNGAKGYFCAGEKASEQLTNFVKNDNPVYSYRFGNAEKRELDDITRPDIRDRNEEVLVIGQYEAYKGLDIAVKVAQNNPKTSFIFVGMGWKEESFRRYIKSLGLLNIEIIPFLQKEELTKLYKKCGLLMLPSRQECWGLVINEAASFGMPIVSTWGSGAAEEFLSPKYDEYLANPEDIDDLANCFERLLKTSEQEKEEYSKYLYSKSKAYNIEENVNSFLKGLEA
ncbi:Glycosyl transferases group 1 [Lachnospiraceae bacterium G11]|nr:Glycosyl transferases group 1 [Lachnospiraceae bacterium G11]